MTPDQLRRYIADAEKASAAHYTNATPELFAALCRLAVAAMDEDEHGGDEGYGRIAQEYHAALRALKELP